LNALPLLGPVALALSTNESHLYILDKNRILNVSLIDPTHPTGVLAGQIAAGYADGFATHASFYAPKALIFAGRRIV